MAKQGSPCCVWDLTFNAIGKNETSEDKLKTLFREIAKSWCFQLEQGEKTGYTHFQCRISLKVKARLIALLKIVVDKGCIPNHASPTSKENAGNTFYVCKEESRIAGPWTDLDPVIPEYYRASMKWYPWQQTVIDAVEKPASDRDINVIVNTSGNVGKSKLTCWMDCRKWWNAIAADQLELAKDIGGMVYSMPDTKYCAFIIDMPKAWDTEDKIDKRKVLQTYLALETLKSGMVCDKRNRLKKRYLSRIPHIWVFTNTPPPRHAMSDDRWKIWTIKDLKLIPIKWEDLTGSTPVGATTSGSSDQQFE